MSQYLKFLRYIRIRVSDQTAQRNTLTKTWAVFYFIGISFSFNHLMVKSITSHEYISIFSLAVFEENVMELS